nr:hypothetical protein [Tanacetum cinerariifolium]
QMSEIRELQAADRRRWTVISELLRMDHRRSTELRTTLQGQKQMAPRRTTWSTTDQETINATSVTNAQLQAMIDQGVIVALAAHDALRSTNGDDSHNSRTGIVGHEAAYGMSWKMLMKMMTDKYCPRNEIRKLEMELWDLKPKTMQEAIKIATELIDKKIRTFAEPETVSKRKFENTSRNTQNQPQQHSNKRQNIGQVYTATSGEKKQYGGSKTLCAKCNYHHNGPWAPKCRNCNKIGHFACDYRSAANTNNANNQRGTGSG